MTLNSAAVVASVAMNEDKQGNQLSKPVANVQLELWDGTQLPALRQDDNWQEFYYQWLPAYRQTFPASVNPRRTSTFNQSTCQLATIKNVHSHTQER